MQNTLLYRNFIKLIYLLLIICSINFSNPITNKVITSEQCKKEDIKQLAIFAKAMKDNNLDITEYERYILTKPLTHIINVTVELDLIAQDDNYSSLINKYVENTLDEVEINQLESIKRLKLNTIQKQWQQYTQDRHQTMIDRQAKQNIQKLQKVYDTKNWFIKKLDEIMTWSNITYFISDEKKEINRLMQNKNMAIIDHVQRLIADDLMLEENSKEMALSIRARDNKIKEITNEALKTNNIQELLKYTNYQLDQTVNYFDKIELSQNSSVRKKFEDIINKFNTNLKNDNTKEKIKAINNVLKANNKIITESFHYSMYGGFMLSLHNAAKNDDLPNTIINTTNQFFGDYIKSSKDKFAKLIKQENLDKKDILFLSEFSQKIHSNYSKNFQYDPNYKKNKSDIAILADPLIQIKNISYEKNPLGVVFKKPVQRFQLKLREEPLSSNKEKKIILKREMPLDIFHIHAGSNSEEKPQLIELLKKIEEICGFMIGDFNCNFIKNEETVRLDTHSETNVTYEFQRYIQQATLGSNGIPIIIRSDIENKGYHLKYKLNFNKINVKRPIYIRVPQSIDARRGAQSSNQQQYLKINITSKQDNNGVVLTPEFLQKIQENNWSLEFESSYNKSISTEIGLFDHNKLKMTIKDSKDHRIMSFTTINLFNDMSAGNSKVYQNLKDIGNVHEFKKSLYYNLDNINNQFFK